ncbi:DNA-directed RNA polymerase subunit H [Candidatus Micrarchaeota archaeon]|nr:DNA-directed RNA polymerase subunit H [Candidatus Micrarchaeota archaeon]
MTKPQSFSHEFVPKHEILHKKEKEEVLSKLGVTPQQLPRIKKADPAIASLGAEMGDVIKITRNDSKADTTEYSYYRMVVK